MSTTLNRYVTFLSHFDELKFGRPVDETGRNPDGTCTATISTPSKFGAGALSASSTGGQRAFFPWYGTFFAGGVSSFAIGAADFSIEAWFFVPPSSLDPAELNPPNWDLISIGDNDNQNVMPYDPCAHGLNIRVAADGALNVTVMTVEGGTLATTLLARSSAMSAFTDGYHHVELRREAGAFGLFLDGVQEDMKSTYPGPITQPTTISEVSGLYVGAAWYPGTTPPAVYPGTLLIDELRITIGATQYSGASYSVPTAAFSYGGYAYLNSPVATLAASGASVSAATAALVSPSATLAAGLARYSSDTAGIGVTSTTTAWGTVNSPVDAIIVTSGTKVAIKYAMVAGTTYTIELKGSDSGFGTMVDTLISGVYTLTNVYQSGTYNDDIASGVRESRTSFTPTVSGTYGVVVGGYGSNTGSMRVFVTAPEAAVEAESATAVLVSPTGSLHAFGGAVVQLVSPAGRAEAAAHDSLGERAAQLISPIATLTFFGGANSALVSPRAALSTYATVAALGSAALISPVLQLIALATVAGAATAMLRSPLIVGAGYSGAVSNLFSPSARANSSGTLGSVVTAVLISPTSALISHATARGYGVARLVSPSIRRGVSATAWIVSPITRLSSSGGAVVAVSYVAYAVNLKHDNLNTNEAPIDEVTRYTNFPFTHVVRYKNSYYGANNTGLYLLEGTTDDGAAISFEVKTAETDFAKASLKTVESGYFAGRLGAAETITLYAREETTHAMSFTTPRSTAPQNHRQVFPRGVKARHFALGISGSKEFELDTVDLSVGVTNRRI